MRYDAQQPFAGSNYTEDQGLFSLLDSSGNTIGNVMAAKRFYPARNMPTTEAGILTRGVNQYYVALGDALENGGMVVRLWWKPSVTLIWLGTVAMVLGGLLSLMDRRLRVGAPARAKKAVKAVSGVA